MSANQETIRARRAAAATEQPRKRRARKAVEPHEQRQLPLAEQQPAKAPPRARAPRVPRARRVLPEVPQRLFLRGTHLKPTGERVVACLAGSKQAIMVDLLRRKEGATMEELKEALAGGRRSWTEASVRAGFGWDMKLKGYGVRSTFDEGTFIERFHLVVPSGQRIPKHHVNRTRRDSK